MGILNVTPDSFSDGNNYLNLSKAVEQAESLINHGADIIDIGGESTRPGAEAVNIQEEIDRVLPVVEEVRKFSQIPVSVDTRKAQVAEACIKAGANMINDVSALRYDADMVNVLKIYPNIGIILMHMQGEPSNMQISPNYNNVINDIKDFLKSRISYCLDHNISLNRIIIDPGIGFGKTLTHNLLILNGLATFKELSCPVLLGASRKRFISEIAPSEPSERLSGSLASTAKALHAGIDMIRIHDVKEHSQFIKVYQKILHPEA